MCPAFLNVKLSWLGEDAENSMQPVGAIYTVGVRIAITKLIEEVNFYEVITMPTKEKL